jgi:hypothetical protein
MESLGENAESRTATRLRDLSIFSATALLQSARSGHRPVIEHWLSAAR